jgi:membrane-bound serine protease (ClpP class)
MQAFAQYLWLLLTNPNIAFLLLVVGLWSVVFAVSLPGTGLPEAAAAVCLALAALGLFRLPVNLAGLLLLGLALALFILEFQAQAHGMLLLAGGVAMALGALFLFRDDAPSPAQVSWVTIVAAPLVSTAFFGYLIRKGLAAQRAPAFQDLRRLIGASGVARTAIGREGTVYVAGEEWSATAAEPIPAGAAVTVVERRGLTLVVQAQPQPAAQPER